MLLYPDLLGRPIGCLVSGGAEWGDRVWDRPRRSPRPRPASRRAPSRALAKGLRPRDAAFRKDPVRRKSIHHRVTIITAAGCRGPFIGLPIGTDPNTSINRHSAFLVKCQLAIEDTIADDRSLTNRRPTVLVVPVNASTGAHEAVAIGLSCLFPQYTSAVGG